MNLSYLGPTPSLNQLKPGEVKLNAPIEHDAIQLGRTGRASEMIRLRVDIATNLARVAVTREDGLPLQLESHIFPRDAMPALEYRLVLAEPVGHLTLCRHVTEPERWVVSEVPLTENNHSPLTFFAQTIGQHCFYKQFGFGFPPL